jgi:hypothetical protein
MLGRGWRKGEDTGRRPVKKKRQNKQTKKGADIAVVVQSASMRIAEMTAATQQVIRRYQKKKENRKINKHTQCQREALQQ